MISAANYTTFTGLTAPADLDVRVMQVVSALQLALGRWFESAARIEYVKVYADGVAYPLATPVTASADGYEFTPSEIELPWPVPCASQIISYTGGWAPYESGTAHDLPPMLAQAISWGVATMANPDLSVLPSGVQSLNIAGEFAVTREAGTIWGADGHPVPAWAAPIAHLGGRCVMLAAPYRRIR
jgi:hypothetical protein